MNKTNKILICLSLVIIVAGAFIFGFLGFSPAKDEKTTYQVSVVVEGYADADKLAQAKTVTENYFTEIGIKPAAVDKLNDGSIYKYTFNEDYSSKIEVNEIRNRVSEVTSGVYNVEVGVYKVEPQSFVQSLYVILAGCIAVVACAVFVFITEKFAGAFTVICTSVFAAVLTAALLAVTRIPAGNYAYLSAVAAAALTGIATCGVLSRCKEIMRNVANEKMSFAEVSEKAVKDSVMRFVFLFAAVLIIAIAFFAFGNADTRALSLQILLADVSAALTVYVLTPTLWTAFKSSRKKQPRKQIAAVENEQQPEQAVEE